MATTATAAVTKGDEKLVRANHADEMSNVLPLPLSEFNNNNNDD